LPFSSYVKSADWNLIAWTKFSSESCFRPQQKQIQVDFTGNKQIEDITQEYGIGYFCQSGVKGFPNQDDIFILVNSNFALIGVFDGHGTNGHYCSYVIQQMLPRLILTNTNFNTDFQRAFNESFVYANDALKEISSRQKNFTITTSGTTATIICIKDKQIYVANVGDSRAILAKRFDNSTNNLISYSLTKDHNFEDQYEEERILQAGGEIRADEGIGTLRFYCKDKNYPGLAMSRSIGDTLGKIHGIICEPNIEQIEINSECEFIVACSDGVWEKLNNEDVSEIVSRYGKEKSQEAAKNIVEKARNLWKSTENYFCDDISCIIYWLK